MDGEWTIPGPTSPVAAIDDGLDSVRADLTTTADRLSAAIRERHATRRALAAAEAQLEHYRAAHRLREPCKTLQEAADRLRLTEDTLSADHPPEAAWQAARAQWERCATDADAAECAYEQARLAYDTARRILASYAGEARDG